MMYEGLVKRLRYAASYDERLVIEDCKEAADAIEELSAQCDNLHDALIGLDAVVPRWISVDDQLPKMNQRVIAMQSGRTWEAGMFQGLSYLNKKGDPHIWQWKGNIFKHIDYWMPKKGALPEPPKDGE